MLQLCIYSMYKPMWHNRQNHSYITQHCFSIFLTGNATRFTMHQEAHKTLNCPFAKCLNALMHHLKKANCTFIVFTSSPLLTWAATINFLPEITQKELKKKSRLYRPFAKDSAVLKLHHTVANELNTLGHMPLSEELKARGTLKQICPIIKYYFTCILSISA